jgi:hypothetical protein
MKKIVLWLVVVGGLGLGASACLIPVYVDDPGGFSRTYPPAFSKTVDLVKGEAVAVDNPVGDVEIFGWDRDEVEVSAEWGWDRYRGRRIGFYGFGRQEPDVEVTKEGGLVRIGLRPSAREGDEARGLRFILNVPRSVELREVRVSRGLIEIGDLFGKAFLDMGEGDVQVKNFSGSLEVSMGEGAVEAEILDLRPEDAIRIRSRQGNVTVILESDVKAKVEADAPAGRITSDFDLGAAPGEKNAVATIGGGEGASIRLSALDGDIRLRKVR